MRAIRILPLMLYLMICGTSAGAGDFIRGADISFLPQVEAGGGVFKSGGQPADCLAILADHGINTARLRIWHTPAGGINGLAATLDLAERAGAEGLSILLDFHYSDTWADPGHQTKPSAWAALPFAVLKDSVRVYTRDVLAAFDARGVTPDMVQIGNEIPYGMLWNEGRVGDAFDTPEQWTQLRDLIQAGIDGVDDALAETDRPEIMIHFHDGGDNGWARWFFDNLLAYGIDFDVIGLSYYPWWHGTLAELETNLNDLATRYDKDLVVVETSYPWTMGWFDDTHNLVGLPEQLLPGYPATPDGQRDFLAEVLRLVKSAPDSRGRGVCWWAPEWIASPEFGSSGENLTLFDDEGEVLPSLQLFADPAPVPDPPIRSGLRLSPNPFQDETLVSLLGAPSPSIRVEVYDVRGRLVVQREDIAAGHGWTWRTRDAAAGTYLFRVTGPDGAWLGRGTLVR